MLIYFADWLGACADDARHCGVEKILLKMGADDAMLGYGMIYGRLVLLGIPFYMLENMFQNFLIAAEKPQLGLIVTIAAGLTNMVWMRCLLRCLAGAWQVRRWQRHWGNVSAA